MLRCGLDWQPHAVLRVIETFSTSTRVAKVATDDGNAFLKGMGNPAGVDALATELVAAELAAWFGIRTAPFAILSINDIAIPMDGVGQMDFGPAFASKEIAGATADGAAIFLRKLRQRSDVAKLVLFDTWIRNSDRCPPDPKITPYNRDNLFFSPVGRKFDIVALDHSHCFVETTLADEIGARHLEDDERIYGLFPEFRPFIHPCDIADAVRRLRQIDMPTARQIVGSLPPQWGVGVALADAWAALILERAQRVATFAPVKLVDEPCLEL